MFMHYDTHTCRDCGTDLSGQRERATGLCDDCRGDRLEKGALL